MIKQILSFKASAIEENLINRSQCITFQHLRNSFVGHDYSFPEEYVFCLHEMFFV